MLTIYQYIKFFLLVLVLSACTLDVDSDESESNGDAGVNGTSVNENNNAGTNTPTNAQPNAQPNAEPNAQPNVQPNEVSPVNDSPTPTSNDPAPVSDDPVPASDNPAPTTDDPTSGTEDPTSTTDDPNSNSNDQVDMPPQVEAPEPPANSPIVRIPFSDPPNAPRIDAETLEYIVGTEQLEGEWRAAAQLNSENNRLNIDKYMFGEAGTNNDSANHHWAAIHDGNYLYLLVVTDDAGEHHQDTNELRKPWKDDSIEIFIDGNHSRLTEYDGVDDFHFTINLFSSAGVANSSYNGDPRIRQSARSAPMPSDLIFVAGPLKGPVATNIERGRKDIYEIRIKLSELNIQVGAPFGIEIQINDDDDGGERDAKWGWSHPEGTSLDNDLTWQNPSYMGTAILLR